MYKVINTFYEDGKQVREECIVEGEEKYRTKSNIIGLYNQYCGVASRLVSNAQNRIEQTQYWVDHPEEYISNHKWLTEEQKELVRAKKFLKLNFTTRVIKLVKDEDVLKQETYTYPL